jgi:RNA polymerase sigma factor (sigma-70 family)
LYARKRRVGVQTRSLAVKGARHNGHVPATDIRQTVDAVWRMEAAKIVATLTRAVGDVGLAEDLAQEALVDALTQWTDTGVPRNAGAWLTTVAKRKAIDHWRRQDNLDAKYATLARDLETRIDEPAWDPDRIDDDVLRLVFISSHPVLSREGQIALTLRVVGGLTTDEIARAFLSSTPTIAARITRAKKTLAAADVPFEVPDRSEYPQRLSAVLSVIYLIYNEGYSASFGQRWVRDELCTEALRLGRVLAALVADEPEVHGLVSLMEFQSSRFGARTDADGTPILLEDQNRTKWDRAQIGRGVAALERAAQAVEKRGTGWGPYALQAALAECHATAPAAADTDWDRIVALYDGLTQIAPSPIVELNRAVAVAMADPAEGPRLALEIVDGLTGLDGSYLLPSVRGELLSRVGRNEEAAAEFARAADLTDNDREREVLTNKAIRARTG